MSQTLTIAPAGLWTDPNPLSAAPDGAMTEALNVVITRPGVVEPRPGLQSQSGFSAIAVDEDIIRIIPFEGDLLVLTKDASDGTGHAYWYTANDDMTQTGTFQGATSAWDFTVGRAQATAHKGNLYITCAEGVFRCTAPGDDTAARAGIPRPPPTLVDKETTGGFNYPFVAGTAWAYRVCETLTAGKIAVRSAPSSRIVEMSYAGSAASLTEHTFARTPSNVSEFYRSPIASAYNTTPSDEMTMVGTAAASSSEFEDDSPVAAVRGASLYTNSTQQGADLENGITPLCRDVATFRDMTFFAAATRAPAMAFEMFGIGGSGPGGSLFSPSRMTWSGASGGGITVSGGSATVTGLSAANTAVLRAGMRVVSQASTNPANADLIFPDDTYITSVGATSFTMNNQAIGGDNGYVALDWIEVSVVDSGGTTTERVFAGSSAAMGATSNAFVADYYVDAANEDPGGGQALAYKLSALFSDPLVTVSAFGDGDTTPWTFIVESFAHDVTSITVKMSRADITPERIDSTTGKTATGGLSAATLAWSKPGEPEHVPPGYWTEIGAADKAILRIVPTRDSLFVFKEDGVWRISGYSPESLQVDEYDRTMRLVHPDAACEWDGRVAAWTNKGVMLISEGGAEEISLPIANIIEAAGETHMGAAAMGVFLCAWLDKGVLLLGIPSTTSTGYAEYIYCWSQRTRAWTRWNHDLKITTAAAVDESIYFGTRAADASSKATLILGVVDSYDYSTSVTVATVDGTSVTINGGSGWTPAVGDAVRKSSVNYVVTTVASSTAFTVHTTGLTTGAASALTKESSRITFTARDGENAGAEKLYQYATAIYGSTAGVVSHENAFTTDRSQTQSTANATLTYTASDAPTTVRARIPRESKRCTRLTHTIEIDGALQAWQLHGCSYEFVPLSGRVPDAA